MNTKEAIDRLEHENIHQFYLMEKPNIIVQMRAVNAELISDYHCMVKWKDLPRKRTKSLKALSIETKTMIEHWINERRR